MRRPLALTLSLLAAGAALGVAAAPATAATGPDLSVGTSLLFPDDPGGGRPVPLDSGGVVAGQITLDNNGDTTTAATLTITLNGFDRSTLEVTGAASGAAVACTPGAGDTVVCPVTDLAAGALPAGTHDAALSFQVQQLPAAAAGSTVSLGFDLEPTTGVEANPADNTHTVTFAMKASADLQTSITPAPAVLVAGVPTTFTLAVANAGPDLAPAATGTAILQTNDEGFTVTTADPAVAVTRNQLFSVVTWNLGDLPVGASRRTTFTVTAATAGTTAAIGVVSRSAATDPVPCTDRACNFDQTSQVTVVAPTAAPSPASGPTLAATGAAPGLTTGLGLGLVVVGTVVMLGARRRVRG